MSEKPYPSPEVERAALDRMEADLSRTLRDLPGATDSHAFFHADGIGICSCHHLLNEHRLDGKAKGRPCGNGRCRCADFDLTAKLVPLSGHVILSVQ